MKKFLALILAVCIIFAVGISYLNFSDRDEVIAQYQQALPSPDTGVQEVPAASQEIPEDAAETVEYVPLDRAAIYALHSGDEAVMTMDGDEVTWNDYYYCLSSQLDQVEEIFQMLALYYGQKGDWNAVADPNTNESYAQVAQFNTEAMLRQMYAIENMSQELGTELSAEQQSEMEAELAAEILSLCGEGGTEEDFFAKLAELNLSEELYRRIMALNYLYINNHDTLYGAEGELVDKDVVSAWMAEQGYMRANHILFMTIDPSTGEALEQSVIDEKLAQANSIIAELSTIEDPAELKARFEALKLEHCEDTGKEAYPEGYVFTSGTMVVEFEDACLALEDYQISQPVESKYGYHVLLRLPLDADAAISSSSGAAQTGLQLYISNLYEQTVSEAMDAVEVVYAEGFEGVDIPSFVAAAE